MGRERTGGWTDKRVMVKCKLCGKKLKFITDSHVKCCNGVTLVEYRKQFPNAKIQCSEILEQKKQNALEQWANKEQRKRKVEGIRRSRTKEFSRLLKKLWNKSGRRENAVDKTIKSWKDPIVRKKRVDNLQVGCRTIESRENRKNGQKERYSRPEELKKQVERLKRIREDKEVEDRRYTNLLKVIKSKLYREKLSQTMSKLVIEGKVLNGNGSVYKNGKFFSVKNNQLINYRSSFELRYYRSLEKDDLVKKYVVEPFRLQYFDRSEVKKHYIPDVLVIYRSGVYSLVEIKPEGLLDYGVNPLKIKVLKEYCKNNSCNCQIITEKELDSLEKKQTIIEET